MSKGFASVAIAAMIMGGGIAVLVDLTGTPTLKPAVPLSPDVAPMEHAIWARWSIFRSAIRKYDVVSEYPHDPQALNRGLICTGGFFYESIGGQDQSLIKVELETGRVIKQLAVDSRFLAKV